MTILPDTYGFVLEQEYRHVRTWVQTGKLSTNLSFLTGILQANRAIVTDWVNHNEAHRRMVLRHFPKATAPLWSIGFADYAAMYQLMLAGRTG